MVLDANFQRVVYKFEHCRENDEAMAQGLCASEDETIDFWNKTRIVMYATESFIDMANTTNPIQKISFPATKNEDYADGLSTRFQLELALNTGRFQDSRAGFLETDPIDQEFLTIDNISKSYRMVNDERLKLKGGTYTLFDLEYVVIMSERVVRSSRKLYTLLDLLGDCGGFIEAITLIVGFLMSYYTTAMFNHSLSSQFDTATSLEDQPLKVHHLQELNTKLKKKKNTNDDGVKLT